MDLKEFRLHDGKKGAALLIRVTPRASDNKIAGILNDGTIQVHLKANPVDQNFNDILLDFLSEVLNLSKRRLEIVGGNSGRDKLVSFLDLEAEELHRKVVELI